MIEKAEKKAEETEKVAKEAEEEYEATKDEALGNSPLKQVQKQKKNNDLLSMVAVGTTAYLTARAIKCCSSSVCSMCAPWTAMATLAALQTKKMFKKSDELALTACTMSTDKNDPVCAGGGSGSIKIGDKLKSQDGKESE